MNVYMTIDGRTTEAYGSYFSAEEALENHPEMNAVWTDEPNEDNPDEFVDGPPPQWADY